MKNTSPLPPLDWREHLLKHLEDYAALAYQKYMEMGRGALIINLRAAEYDSEGLESVIPIVYASNDDQGGPTSWSDPTFVEHVRSYQPENEFVYVCLLVEGVSCGLLRPTSPYQAHKRMMANATQKRSGY